MFRGQANGSLPISADGDVGSRWLGGLQVPRTAQTWGMDIAAVLLNLALDR